MLLLVGGGGVGCFGDVYGGCEGCWGGSGGGGLEQV